MNKPTLEARENGATVRLSVDVPVTEWKRQLADSVTAGTRTAEEAQRDLRLEVLNYAARALTLAAQSITMTKEAHIARESAKCHAILAAKPDESGNLDARP